MPVQWICMDFQVPGSCHLLDLCVKLPPAHPETRRLNTCDGIRYLCGCISRYVHVYIYIYIRYTHMISIHSLICLNAYVCRDSVYKSRHIPESKIRRKILFCMNFALVYKVCSLVQTHSNRRLGACGRIHHHLSTWWTPRGLHKGSTRTSKQPLFGPLIKYYMLYNILVDNI
jgi:hypothetical protein